MRFFLDKPTSAKSDEPSIQATNCYLEIEWPINSNTCVVIYIIPRTETSVFVATCWDTAFDTIIAELDIDTIKTIAETWPTLALLLNNGLGNKYRNGAIIRLEDADYGETKWFVASVAGNISFKSENGLFTAQTKEAINTVMSTSLQLFVELQEKKPSIMRAIGKGIAAGLGVFALGAIAEIFGFDLGE